MADAMAAKPWTIVKLSRQLAEIHVAMHAIDGIDGLPSWREAMAERVRGVEGLSDELREATLAALEGMSGGDRLCHGDYHQLNVMMTDGGPMVIDWVDAKRGNPLADVARTSVVIESATQMAEGISGLEKLAMRWSLRIYLRRYFELRPGGEEAYRSWRPIVAAARLSESIPGTEDWLRAQVALELG